MSSSSSDYPVTPWLRNQIRMDREDVAAGRESDPEAAYYARQAQVRREALARSRRKRDLWEHETPIASEIEPQERRY